MIYVKNMTSLFRKEILIYSFFDIKLSKPFRVIWGLYFFLVGLLVSVPMLLILPIGPVTICFALIIPAGAASLMSKPIWGNKNFIDFLQCQIKYAFSPKKFYDWEPNKDMSNYYIDSIILVSRKADFAELYKIKKAIREEENGK